MEQEPTEKTRMVRYRKEDEGVGVRHPNDNTVSRRVEPIERGQSVVGKWTLQLMVARRYYPDISPDTTFTVERDGATYLSCPIIDIDEDYITILVSDPHGVYGNYLISPCED